MTLLLIDGGAVVPHRRRVRTVVIVDLGTDLSLRGGGFLVCAGHVAAPSSISIMATSLLENPPEQIAGFQGTLDVRGFPEIEPLNNMTAAAKPLSLGEAAP